MIGKKYVKMNVHINLNLFKRMCKYVTKLLVLKIEEGVAIRMHPKRTRFAMQKKFYRGTQLW